MLNYQRVIFHSYVKLPEGKGRQNSQLPNVCQQICYWVMLGYMELWGPFVVICNGYAIGHKRCNQDTLANQIPLS